MLRFEWDERKNKRNRTKHGVWFEEAQTVFEDPRGRLFQDPDHSEEEERFVLLGMFGGKSIGRRSLLPRKRVAHSHHFRTQSD